MSPRDLPTLNAALNLAAALLAALGYLLIRRGHRTGHRRAMLGALACSALFLVSYLSYHALFGSRRFAGSAFLRSLYLTILVSHTLLAVAILPLLGATLRFALTERYDRHRRLARLALPIWAYVSVTGVVVYVMLYRL